MSKSAFLTDKNGEILQAIIIYTDTMISIRMVDINNELLGYLNIFFQNNKRLFLSEIYCYDKYRGGGIATKLSELADYLLKDYEGYILRGIYHPTQMSSDLKTIPRSKEELDNRARIFYYKNGYEILSYDCYMNNRKKYYFLDPFLDFNLNGYIANEIVYKLIKKKDYNFYEDNNVIYYSDNILTK